MFRFVLALALAIGLIHVNAAHADDALGFIISYDLRGADLGGNRAAKTVVIHKGSELLPKLWMPLVEGDIVFIRDPQSSVVLDLGKKGRVEVKGAQQRFTVSAGGSPDEGTWGMLTQIAELFGSDEGEDTPANLISKGDGSLAAPIAVHGLNYIVADARPVWIAWQGGKAPYTLTLDQSGVRHPLASTDSPEFETAIPRESKSRFAILIEDSLGKRVRVAFQLKSAAPTLPKPLADAAAEEGVQEAVLAGWLAAQDDGAWRLEVARILRALPKDNKTAARLLKAFAAGWRPHE